jgi:cleavage and polyadenylation specificity factor subunit 1
VFTLSFSTRTYPVITAHEGLPYDALSLVPCPAEVGGVLVLCATSIIHVLNSTRRVVLTLSGWMSRESGVVGLESAIHQDLDLTGARATFVDTYHALVVTKEGAVHVLTLVIDGTTLSSLDLGPAIARTNAPVLIRPVGDKNQVFVGSSIGDSVLLDVAQVEEEVAMDTETDVPEPQVEVKKDDGMELDEDDG